MIFFLRALYQIYIFWSLRQSVTAPFWLDKRAIVIPTCHRTGLGISFTLNMISQLIFGARAHDSDRFKRAQSCRPETEGSALTSSYLGLSLNWLPKEKSFSSLNDQQTIIIRASKTGSVSFRPTAFHLQAFCQQLFCLPPLHLKSSCCL